MNVRNHLSPAIRKSTFKDVIGFSMRNKRKVFSIAKKVDPIEVVDNSDYEELDDPLLTKRREEFLEQLKSMRVHKRAICGPMSLFRKMHKQNKKEKIKVNQICKSLTKKYTRVERSYSRSNSRLNSACSEFGHFSGHNISTHKKKSNFGKFAKKESVPVTDYEVDKILKQIRDRQRRTKRYEEKVKLAQSHSEVLRDSREQRAIENHNDIMKLWKKDSKRISTKVGRAVKDSVFVRCDGYRKRREALCENSQKKSLPMFSNRSRELKQYLKQRRDKPSPEKIFSQYSFKMMLRSDKRNKKLQKSSKDKTHLNSPGRETMYGIYRDHQSSRSINGRNTSVDSQSHEKMGGNLLTTKDVKNMKDSSNLLLQKAKKNTFGSGMDYQYLQEIGCSSGIWFRMNARRHNRPPKETIIRKSLSFWKDTYEDGDVSKSMPRVLLKTSDTLLNSTERCSTNGISNRRSRMCLNTSYSELPIGGGQADQYEGIEIIGKSKLEAETLFVKSIKGKIIMKNHILNDDGEGEPAQDEETL
ncbi:unnamed protein product [Moneuplotes crassus]|uniref:Uncharacterized protein n=1 Tax=Euplotes crassus TaxID=5936 RepID=A0AAD1U8B2_EUPCR|nr:unnamed protein product [Moneuplotes crassus]